MSIQLRQILNSLSSFSDEENGKEYVLQSKAGHQIFADIYTYCKEQRRFFISAILIVEKHSSINLLDDSVTLPDVSDNLSFTLTLEKDKSNFFPIVTYKSFLTYFRRSCRQGAQFFGFINNALKNPFFIDSAYQFSYFRDDQNFQIKRNLFCKAVNFVACNQIRLIPSNIQINSDHSADTDAIKIKDFYSSLINFYSLVFISNSFDLKNSEISFCIDGYREIKYTLDVNIIENGLSEKNIFSDLFQWAFNDNTGVDANIGNFEQIYIERLGIARNVFSLEIKPQNGDQQPLQNITDGVLSKCKSNYNIYLKSKTKDYFDLRMNLEEHVEKLVRNLSEESSAFFHSFRNNMYLFVGVVFSTLLLSFTSDSYTGSFYDFYKQVDVVFIVLGFVIVNIVMLLLSAINLWIGQNGIQGDITNFRNRYSKLLDETDINDIINTSFGRRVKSNRTFFWVIVTVWLCFCYALLSYREILDYIRSVM